MKVQHIQEFLFDSAIYNLRDLQGQPYQLKVDYKNGRFQVDGDQSLNPTFIAEVTDIARDLLARKHGINIAERE